MRKQPSQCHRLAVLPLVACLIVGLSGCFSNVRPLRRLEQGAWMVGGSVQMPGSFVDAELEGWARVAPADGFDVTLGAYASLPMLNNEPMLGAFLELQTHVRLADDRRLVLQAEGRILRLVLDRPGTASVHAKGTLASLFTWDGASVQGYFGPKLGLFTGMTTQSDGDFNVPWRTSEEGSAVVFTGLSAGFETGDEVIFALGGDLGILFDVNGSKSVAPSLSFGMALAYEF